MPLRNRVDPSGKLHAISARGSLMGNRGNLCTQGEEGAEITRFAQGKRWIICVTHYRYQVLPLATLHNNTQLFFLDEATALAAGHRPCARCRRESYDSYREAWQLANPKLPKPDANAMDSLLHQQRNLEVSQNRVHRMPLAEVPDGTLVRWLHQPTLVFGGWLQQWSFAGYNPVQKLTTTAAAAEVPVLTPSATVAVLAAGYLPLIHDTAHDGS